MRYRLYQNGTYVNTIVGKASFIGPYCRKMKMTFVEENIPEITPPTLEDLQRENKLLKAQLQAQTERSDFIEDCIAEMAMTVYS